MALHFVAANIRRMLWVCALGALVGCSSFNWRRMVYDSAEQYGCQQHNSGRMDQAQRDASCTNPQDPGHVSYDDYRAARKAAGAEDE